MASRCADVILGGKKPCVVELTSTTADCVEDAPPTATAPVKVFAPAKVCAPVVTIPGFVSSAGASFNSPAVIDAALAVDVSLMDPMDAIPIKDTPAGHVPSNFGPKILLSVVLM